MSNTTYTTFDTHQFDSDEFRDDILQIITEEDFSQCEPFENVVQFGGWNEKIHRQINWSSLRSGKNNPMYGKKRAGTYSKETLQKMSESMKGKNACRVQIHGIMYPSCKAAEYAYPHVKVRCRLDNPKYPDWFRLDTKTKRPRYPP
tara:strand:- start:135 stop:572 length:438 start_codon:yes stop_codon:yes gene_type:complete